MYKLVEKCTKYGIEIVHTFANYEKAMVAIKKLARKYHTRAKYYAHMGYKAVLSQGRNAFASTTPKLAG